jgi:hypothetical protein
MLIHCVCSAVGSKRQVKKFEKNEQMMRISQFYQLDPQIEPYVFRHTHGMLGKTIFLYEEGSNTRIQSVSICLELVP